METILKWGPVDIMTQISGPVFKSLKLYSMIALVFSGDPMKAIVNAYPDTNFSWQDHNLQDECVHWLSKKLDKLVPTKKEFIRYGLSPLLKEIDKDFLIRRAYGMLDVNLKDVLTGFLKDHRISIEGLAEIIGIAFESLYSIQKRYKKTSLELDIKIYLAIQKTTHILLEDAPYEHDILHDEVQAGYTLKQMRKHKYIPAPAVVNELKVSKRLVEMWENGTILPTMEKLALLSKVLQCDVWELYEYHERLKKDNFTPLKIYRLKSGISLQQLSERTGISIRNIVEFEVGLEAPDVRHGNILSKTLCCSSLELGIKEVPAEEDITDQKYDGTTVLGKTDKKNLLGEAIWICRCSCDFNFECTASHLKSSSDSRCDVCRELGQRKIGKLTILNKSKEFSKDKSPKALWECQCDCGQPILMTTLQLQVNKYPSCGCENREAKEDDLSRFLAQHERLISRYRGILDGGKLQSNKSGKNGVSWSKNAWDSRIRFQDKIYLLGRYQEIEDAIAVRIKAENLLYRPYIEWYEKIKAKELLPVDNFNETSYFKDFEIWYNSLRHQK